MKILIVYATAGAGHRKAAEALYDGFKSTDFRDEIVLIDSLDYTYPLFKKMYSGIYTFLITWTPALWGFFFRLLDLKFLRSTVALTRRIYNFVNAYRLHAYLQKEHFDYIISTHFLANEVAGALKKAGKIRPTLIGVITDFDVHSIWLSEGIDRYMVASDWTKQKIVSMGVAHPKVFVTGIPTHQKFSQAKNVACLREKMNMRTDRFTVLIATGSFGIGPIEQMIASIKGFQIAVICGHNKNLYQRLKDLNSDTVKVFGLVDNMDEMMALSDVMITKPGGLSISEALVSGLPMIFFNAIPGQETNNIKVLSTYGVGIKGRGISQIALELKHLESCGQEFAQLKDKVKALSRPHAVADIIALCKAHI